jgi:hypothetical protein
VTRVPLLLLLLLLLLKTFRPARTFPALTETQRKQENDDGETRPQCRPFMLD